MTRHLSLPLSEGETTRLLEGRDIAKLYEYWVFLHVLKATFEVTGSAEPHKVTIHRTELGESLGSLVVQVSDSGRILF